MLRHFAEDRPVMIYPEMVILSCTILLRKLSPLIAQSLLTGAVPPLQPGLCGLHQAQIIHHRVRVGFEGDISGQGSSVRDVNEVSARVVRHNADVMVLPGLANWKTFNSDSEVNEVGGHGKISLALA